MSKALSEAFFPSFSSFVRAIAPSVWLTIFPDDVTILCSVHHDHWPCRPCLGMSAILGAYIGLKKARISSVRYHDVTTTRPCLAVGQWNFGHCDSNFSTPREMLKYNIHECWKISQLTFGLMNVVALTHHCLLFTPPTTLSDDTNYYMYNIRKMVDTFLWSADCILTGVSSTYLTIMALLIIMIQLDFPKNSSRDLLSLRVGVIATLITIIAFVTLLYQLLLQYNGGIIWTAASTFIELIYLIPLATGASSLFPLIIGSAFMLDRTNEKSVIGARIAILGGIIILIGVPLDSTLCYFISAHAPSINTSSLLLNALHLPTLVFLGCDISFIGLNIWLENTLIQELKIQ
jgi:hypothetical protein